MSLTDTKLSDFTWPNDSFGRSVNVKIGLTDSSKDAFFHFTPKSLTLLKSIFDSCEEGPRDRAFSVIGPYGAGKSSFGLFISSLLSRSRSSWLDRSLENLSQINSELSSQAAATITSEGKGYVPVVIQGQKGSITRSLCQGLIDALVETTNSPSKVSSDFQNSLMLIRESLQSDSIDTDKVIELYKTATEQVKQSGFSGLIVIADEFGKFLERAADRGNVPDLVAIQYLAELASSANESQLILIVLLHQSFRDYASTIAESERVEWNKIQGRFQQADFSEESEGLYPLIAACLNRNQDDQTGKLVHKWAKQTYKNVKNIPIFQNSSTWHDILTQVYPFHPVSLYGLPRLSSRLAQNERTLFNFLVSEDPLGFKRYLSRTKVESDTLPSMTFDTVVDYFLYGSRFASWSPDIRKSISQLESALERLGDRPPLEEKIIKILGGIRLLRCGPALPSNTDTLKACLNINTIPENKSFDDAISNLIEHKLIVYRIYSEEYHLWEGSDFDFDAAIEKTRNDIRNDSSIYECISPELRSRPLMANTYGIIHGASRAFERRFKSCEDFLSLSSSDMNTMVEDSSSRKFDGLIIHTMPSTETEISEIQNKCQDILDPRIIITVPTRPSDSVKLLSDLNVLNQITKDNPQIYEDPVALKELEARIDSLSIISQDSLLTLIQPRMRGPVWWWQAAAKEITDGSTANALLSNICETLYEYSPNIKNELINRSTLSTTVVTATKKIADRLTRQSQTIWAENPIEFVGNGPEVSIFKSVFENTGIYKRGKLTAPDDNESNLLPVWNRIEQFLLNSRKSTLDLDSLFTILGKSPYGVKRGLIPLLVWTGLIIHKDNICLYYDGTYIKVWDVETFELFEKIPHRYSVRWIDSEQSIQTVAKGMSVTLDNYVKIQSATSNQKIGINTLLNKLFIWYDKLPAYSKLTSNISSQSRNFRQMITSASDPADLLFSKIPIALECKPLLNESGEITLRLPKTRSNALIDAFSKTVSEISESYNILQGQMLEAMSLHLDCDNDWQSIQERIEHYFNALSNYLHDEKYHILMMSAFTNSDSNQTIWLERLGTYLLGRSLRDWHDDDIKEFEEEMAILAQILRDAERRKFAKQSNPDMSSILIESSEDISRILIESSDVSISEEFTPKNTSTDSNLQTTDNINVKIGEITRLISDRQNLDDETIGKLRQILAQLLIDTL